MRAEPNHAPVASNGPGDREWFARPVDCVDVAHWWKSDRDLGALPNSGSTGPAASCLKHCADQMEFERARDLLRRERARIEQALARDSAPRREELAGQDEMADSASQLYEEEFDEGQADDLRAELAAVERAEARLLDGSYGRSIESGEAIPDARLEAVPTAERTAEEQARFERG
jgi:DnaK suppressor protein